MRAIVTGISGQDGYYMARVLIEHGYEVVGLTSRASDADTIMAEWPEEPVSVEAFDYACQGAIGDVIARVRPRLVFNFAAKSTGQGMFDEPVEMSRLNGGFVLDILEAIRTIDPSISFCQASSAEMYGSPSVSPQAESTPFRPISPYGAAKLYAHNMIGIYRRAFGIRASSAILYNHESTRRGTAFVTRKISRAAAAIKLGMRDHFELGSIDALRDWGYAPEYANAMFLMATSPAPEDYVVATGSLTSVAELCSMCFEYVGLDYRDFLTITSALQRPIPTSDVLGDPGKIHRDLGWKATKSVQAMLAEMVDHDLGLLRSASVGVHQSF